MVKATITKSKMRIFEAEAGISGRKLLRLRNLTGPAADCLKSLGITIVKADVKARNMLAKLDVEDLQEIKRIVSPGELLSLLSEKHNLSTLLFRKERKLVVLGDKDNKATASQIKLNKPSSELSSISSSLARPFSLPGPRS